MDSEEHLCTQCHALHRPRWLSAGLFRRERNRTVKSGDKLAGPPLPGFAMLVWRREFIKVGTARGRGAYTRGR